MLPEAEQGKGLGKAWVVFGGFLAGVYWQWKGIMERQAANGKARHITFGVSVVPTSTVYGLAAWQKLDSRPWGTESFLTKPGASQVVTSKCFRVTPIGEAQAKELSSLGDFNMRIIPKYVFVATCCMLLKLLFVFAQTNRDAGALGVFYENWSPQEAQAVVDTASGKQYEVTVKTSFTYESLQKQLVEAGAAEEVTGHQSLQHLIKLQPTKLQNT
jgi:hypothetical protein